MGVHHAVRALNARVQGGMHHKARRINAVGGAVEHLALEVDFHQVAGRDFAVVQTKGVDQKLLLIAAHAGRHSHGDVVVDHLGPAQHGEDAVAGRELHTGSPLVGMEALCGHTKLLAINAIGCVSGARCCQYTRPLSLAGLAVGKLSLNLAASAEV